MTNEELVRLAQQGDTTATHQLWEQNRGLLALLFRKLTSNPGNQARMKRAGVTMEDVEQCGYLVIVEAVKLYNPEAGARFSSFLNFPLMTVFFDLVGFRTAKQKKEPLSQSLSLDEPLDSGEGETYTRADIVPDPKALQAFENAHERVYQQQLRTVLDELLSKLSPEQAEVIRSLYYDERTIQQVSQQMGKKTHHVRHMEYMGLRAMRRHKRKLEQYREDIISNRSWRSVGFNAWKNGGSVQERVVEYLEARGL